jgi:prolyl 4-hydroxylase
MKNNQVIFDGFFTPAECEEFLNKYSSDFKPMDVLGDDKDHRVAQGKWIFGENDMFVERYKLLVCALTGIPISHQEAPHLVMYDVGGKYDAHHDFFHPNTDYYEGHTKVGGQRVVSTLLYLNDNFTGGETAFPKRDIVVKPKTGRILAWRNITLSNELDYNSLHTGKPVISGKKFVLIIWTRERDLKANNNVKAVEENKKVAEFNHTPLVHTQPTNNNDYNKLPSEFDMNTENKPTTDTDKPNAPTLRELTKNVHEEAENTAFMRLFAAGALTEKEYAHYLTQMVLIYTALEGKLKGTPIMDALPGIERLSNMRKDLKYYTEKVGVMPLSYSTLEYYNKILRIDNVSELFAHYYVRVGGDLFGGQMLKKCVTGANSWYDFDPALVTQLKMNLRKLAVPDLADFANNAYYYNITILDDIIGKKL